MAHYERNREASVYIGNLDEKVTDAIVWELMAQAGPVVNVHIPKDRITSQHQGYGFVEFSSELDAEYCVKIMNMIKLYGKPIRINRASHDQEHTDIGANLFIGHLDPDVDEKLLFETFSSFGHLINQPKIARDPETGASKGYGFISYNSFEAADAVIETMNGQFLMNEPLKITFAYKKDGKGERHGSAAERLLAQQAKKNKPKKTVVNTNNNLPPRPFVPGPGGMVMPPPPIMPGMPHPPIPMHGLPPRPLMRPPPIPPAAMGPPMGLAHPPPIPGYRPPRSPYQIPPTGGYHHQQRQQQPNGYLQK